MNRLPFFYSSQSILERLLVFVIAIFAVPDSFLGAQSTTNDANAALESLIENAWDEDMRENPLSATRTGDHRYNDRLPKVAVAESLRRLEIDRTRLTSLHAIPRDQLSVANQVNYDLFAHTLADDIAASEFKSYLIPITNRSGFHISFPDLAKTSPLESTKDFENFIARLRGFKDYTQQHIDLMRAGIEEGYTLPAVVLEGYRESIETHIVSDAAKSVFYQPFTRFPSTVAESDQERLRHEARAAIENSIVPGYREFLSFMRDEYVPQSRGSIGASALPDGRNYYRFCVRKFTTLDVSPEEVHETGMREVKRIRDEMQEIIKQLKFEGSFAEFLEHLRTSEEFYPKTKRELLNETSFVLKRIDGLLPKLFKTLPRTPYGIREVPSYIAPRTTAAYYMPPSGDGSIAGFYYVNTFQLESRPLYAVQALSLHEAVPGHHLQIALQQEMEGIPNFRRYASFTVFIEGWALYAERLGLEVGFYEDPYSDFGRLTYEMWRACRLVVDTGIHYLGWTREQAIRFMEENSGLSKHNIRAEVDRYIAWPGQALAYKTGELKIRELRSKAEQALGAAFDVRDFHEVVLGQGAIPLDMLERQVDAYIQEGIKE